LRRRLLQTLLEKEFLGVQKTTRVVQRAPGRKKMKPSEALNELRKENKRKFDQSVDLVINLRNIDIKRDNIALVVTIPHKIKEKRVCGFLEERNDLVKTVTKIEFAKYKDKVALRNLVRDFDYFIAQASLMPSVATTFGKVLGPAGKMPSPQLGLLTQGTDVEIKGMLEKISKSIKIRAKEASVKLSIGREGMEDKDILENVKTIYDAVVGALPSKHENVKSVLLKFSMSKPLKVDM
jgi:large subunit ribosomal protein L1